MLLFGPLLLFYSKSLLIPGFTLHRRLLWHFLPYGINFGLNLPFLMMPAEAKLLIISGFIEGRLPLRTTDMIGLSVQVVHLSAYLFWVLTTLRRGRSSAGDTRIFVTDLATRQKWLGRFVLGFSLYLILVVVLIFFVILVRRFDLHANYSYTLVMSAIIYYLAYQLVLHKEIVLADFNVKYKSSPLSSSDKNHYAGMLRQIMISEQPFLNPDLKLADLAKRLPLPSHHLSQLLSEEFGQRFFDLVNHYRVEEFKRRLVSATSEHLSFLGLAMEVGFNSKSSFNTAFKKETGMTPSQFKKHLADRN